MAVSTLDKKDDLDALNKSIKDVRPIVVPKVNMKGITDIKVKIPVFTK